MNLSLLLNFTRQDLIDRYSGSILGGAWSFILPLVNILIFVLVFSKIMDAKLAVLGVEFSQYGYSIYLVAGILAWTAFANSVIRITNVFKDKAGLIAKVNISLAVLPVYILVTESIIFFISMTFFAVFLWLIDFTISWHWLLIPLLLILQQLLAYSLGFLFATLSVFIRDIREFVNVIMQLWFWCTPIVYVINIIPEFVQKLFSYNPMFIMVSAYREVIIFHRLPELNNLLLLMLTAMMLFVLSLYLFRKLERDVRDFI